MWKSWGFVNSREHGASLTQPPAFPLRLREDFLFRWWMKPSVLLVDTADRRSGRCSLAIRSYVDISMGWTWGLSERLRRLNKGLGKEGSLRAVKVRFSISSRGLTWWGSAFLSSLWKFWLKLLIRLMQMENNHLDQQELEVFWVRLEHQCMIRLASYRLQPWGSHRAVSPSILNCKMRIWKFLF